MRFTIGGIQRTSLLDYPDKISAIVFTQGCNFRCGYCHNPNLLSSKSENDIYNLDVFFDFLKKRQGKLDGVVITGGESTLQEDLEAFIIKIKEMGFLVKLDTNGYRPEVIENLISKNLIDYIAMDIKGPLDKYDLITNRNIDKTKIVKSINLILNSNIDYEFRTTVLPIQIEIEDFIKISELIKGAKKYYLQKFVVQSEIYDNKLKTVENYTDENFAKIKEILIKNIDFVDIR